MSSFYRRPPLPELFFTGRVVILLFPLASAAIAIRLSSSLTENTASQNFAKWSETFVVTRRPFAYMVIVRRLAFSSNAVSHQLKKRDGLSWPLVNRHTLTPAPPNIIKISLSWRVYDLFLTVFTLTRRFMTGAPPGPPAGQLFMLLIFMGSHCPHLGILKVRRMFRQGLIHLGSC